MYLIGFRMTSSLMRKQKLVVLLVVLGLFSAQAHAEDMAPRFSEEHHHSKLWTVSAAMLAAVTIADVQSSIGRQEANPFLASPNGQFSGRGLALKGLTVGGVVGVQWLMLRKHPQPAKYAAGANFAATALTGAAVIHNHMVK
jgi:hypothetical protein